MASRESNKMNQATIIKPTQQFAISQDLAQINTHKWFWIFSFLHLLFWTLGPTFCRGNAPFDSVEGIAWGNQLQWGYDKHPFLAPWLTAFATHLAGGIVGWPIYLLSQIAIVITFWAIWRLGQKVLSPMHALLGVVLLEGIYYYNIVSVQFNPNVLMLPLWALTCLFFYDALTEQKYTAWILTGLFAGLSMITKYESALLWASMLCVLIATAEGLECFKHRKLYIAALVAAVVCLPNFIWLVDHNFVSITYAVGRVDSQDATHLPFVYNNLYHPVRFFFEQIGAVAPICIFYAPLFTARRLKQSWSSFNLRYFSVMAISPFVFCLLIALFSGFWLHSLWGIPLFSLTGILMLMWLRPEIDSARLLRFVKTFCVVFLLVFMFRFAFLLWGPYLQHKTNSAQFPGQNIALSLTQQWQQRYHTPLVYVAGSRTIVEHISAYSPDHPIPYFEWSKIHAAWVNEKRMREKGALFAWWPNQKNYKLPAKIAKRFPNAVLEPIQYYHDLTPVNVTPEAVGVAFLPPQKTEE